MQIVVNRYKLELVFNVLKTAYELAAKIHDSLDVPISQSKPMLALATVHLANLRI